MVGVFPRNTPTIPARLVPRYGVGRRVFRPCHTAGDRADPVASPRGRTRVAHRRYQNRYRSGRAGSYQASRINYAAASRFDLPGAYGQVTDATLAAVVVGVHATRPPSR